MSLINPLDLDAVAMSEEEKADKQAQADVMLARKQKLLEALSSHKHLLYKITRWRSNSADGGNGKPDKRELSTLADGANIITSQLADEPGMHTIMLDIDRAAALIPSSTRGKYHLYIDVKLKWQDYEDFLEACARAGVIEKGYLNISKRHMLTSLRMPWIKKGTPEGGK